METSQDKKCCEDKKCCCPCHKMFGVFIVLAGVAGLLAVFGVMSHKAAAVTASVLLILAGVQTMMRGKCKCCGTP